VTFAEIALAVAGMPQAPVIWIVRSTPALRMVPLRES